MSQDYSIWIVSFEGYVHSRCFEEIAISLQAAFKVLGYDVPIVTHPRDVRGTAIVLGANLMPHMKEPPPEDMILYNLEQVQADSPWFQQEYLGLLRAHPVWDYSKNNVEELKQFDVHATLCGIGYMPELSKISKAEHEDIDVLFAGSMNERRQHVIEALRNQGVNVHVVFGTYGSERDDLVARSKIVLNLHFYEARVFEIARVSYLLANYKCVVSETGHDAELEAPLQEGVAFTSYDGLVPKCMELLGNEAERRRIADKGFTLFSAMSQVPMLQRAMGMPAASGI